MIVTEAQYKDLQAHLIYGWLKWANTHNVKITIAIATEHGQELYILGPHIRVYTDVITIGNTVVPYNKIIGLYGLNNEPLLQTDNVSTS